MSFNPSKKRKRMIDQYQDNIKTPPKLVSTVYPVEGLISWQCDSSSDKQPHTVTLLNNCGAMEFMCNCSKSGTYHCQHIHAVIIKMCLTHVENSVDYTVQAENLKTDIGDLVENMDKLTL
jgi:hypothetical protein